MRIIWILLIVLTGCSKPSQIIIEGIHTGEILLDSTRSGTQITSTPNAIIDAGNGAGITLRNARDIRITSLHVRGNGRKDGNTSNGVQIINCYNITIDSLEVEGFQKSGLYIEGSYDIKVDRVYAHDNGSAGISAYQSNRVAIARSVAENNPGDPTNFTNHSGNGIVVGYGRNIIIEHCSATNNGWDMPRVGNGPVGIWAWESDSVTIQHCVSYRNKTSKGGDDGGGFDLDGGVTNSVIQYCTSYENEGSGYGLFQYNGASPWKNNIVRYNVSWNDGKVSAAHAGIYVWNSSGVREQLYGCVVHDNLIYNESGAAIHNATDSNHEKFQYEGNIFIANEIIVGHSESDEFLHNVTTLQAPKLKDLCVTCGLK